MQDPTQLYTRHDGGPEEGPDAPVPPGLGMLVVLTGHMDAGRVALQVRTALRTHLTHRTVAEFDLDQMFDYRARRPRLTFAGDHYRDLRLASLSVQVVSDLIGHPFLLVAGPEPDFQWERFTAALVGLAQEWEVDTVTLLDAAPLPVPHTRRPGVTAHGTRRDAVEGLSTWSPEAEIVSGALQMIELRASEAGIPTAGYTMHVPHYVAEAAYPQAAVAGLEYVGAALGLMLPTDELRDAARDVEAELERQVSGSEEVQAMIVGLEKNFDQNVEDQGRSLLETEGGLPDGDELASAVEAYLAEREETVHPWPRAEAAPGDAAGRRPDAPQPGATDPSTEDPSRTDPAQGERPGSPSTDPEG